MSYDFKIVNADTDSISFCKQDGSPYSPEEIKSLIKELNGLSHELLIWEDDGYYPSVVVVKAKNYILKDQKGKLKIKGSALKMTTKEPALQEMAKKIIDVLIGDDLDVTAQIRAIYLSYIKEVSKPLDITRWAKKVTVTEKILKPERTNEEKMLAAIQGENMSEGDKFYVYFDNDKNLKLVKNYQGDHHVDTLIEKIYKTMVTFESVIDFSQIINYKLKRNKKVLAEILGE